MHDAGLTVEAGLAAPLSAADRYTILGTLGSGSMGVVYRAYDRWLGRDVAVKKLRRGSGTDLYRFKREFRALSDIVHPNLVVLHEMHTIGDEWLVSMELVDGVSFIEWVRHWPSDESATVARGIGGRAPAAPTRDAIRQAPLDFVRLDAALPQLVDGVVALHLCGKLHRDLKPSNVLVTRDGRVVLLDFGLIADLHAQASEHTHHDAAVGTPVYMSPEQAADGPLTAASDWYAVGAMLYEALTGSRPFEGSREDIIHRKQGGPPVRPRRLAPFVPPELDELCMRLLAVRPADRPDGRAIFATLGRAPMPATAKLERAVTTRPFVGRTSELAALQRALRDSRGSAVAMLVRGESGIGKTRLVHHFLDEIADDALILEGRCYLRESVPFRALDGVIDALTRVLLRLPADTVAANLPKETAALARLFPVLHRVRPVALVAAAARLPAELPELRRRALVAMRALLAWLATQRPVAIAIDDVQWGDADSAAFLSDLVNHPEPPPLLLILVQRSEDDAAFASTVTAPRSRIARLDVRTLDLEGLPEVDARRLARVLDADGESVDMAVREARGHPLFLVELTTSGSRSSPLTLDQLIAQRVADLPAPAAALLRAVAVAARPLPLSDAARVAGLPGIGTELSLLLAERLVRLRHLGTDDTTHVEAYHDRVRAAVVAALDPTQLRQVHEALLRVYERGTVPGDLDALAAHCLGAGDPARAAAYAVRAATVADAALAFHRAAELYAVALSTGGGGALERRRLHRRRGQALANAGRLDEAAAAFAEASHGADGAEALELERLRLEQLLRRGRLSEGMALGRRLLERVGIDVPVARRDALRALARQRAVLRRRGYDFAARPESDIAPEVLRRIDLPAAISVAMSVGDPLLGNLVQSHFLHDALEVGEPRRACVALTAELGYLGLAGVSARARVAAAAAKVHELVAELRLPYLTGLASGIEGLVGFEMGAWREARADLEACVGTLCEQATGARWEIDVASVFRLAALAYLGETRELAREAPALLRDAMERGDTYAEHALRSWRPSLAWLVMGRPDDARAHGAVVEAEQPAADAFLLRDFYQVSSQVQVDLYVGDGERAWRHLERVWPALVESDLLCIQSVRVEARFLRARAALAWALAAPPSERDVLVGAATRLACLLGRERAAWAVGLSQQVHAMVAALTGDRRDASTWLDAASATFETCDMHLHATVARLRKGQVEGGVAGTTGVATARAAMLDQAIADPDAMARLLCPWPDATSVTTAGTPAVASLGGS